MAVGGDRDLLALKELLLSKISEVEQRLGEKITSQTIAVGIAMEAADRAVNKAETASDKRFEGVNEFRQALGDSGRLQMPRIEAEKEFGAINEKFDAAIRTIHQRLDAIVLENSKEKGRSSGIHSGWGYAVGAVGLILGMISMFISLSKR